MYFFSSMPQFCIQLLRILFPSNLSEQKCLSLLRTIRCGIILNHRTTAISRLNCNHAMVAPFFLPSVHYATNSQWCYTNSVSFFALLTSWPAVCKSNVFLQLCDQIQLSMHQIFTLIHLTVSTGPSHTQMISAGPK